MELNTGDTAFMLIATAMVMLMTPGLALFYGGLVRSKNVLATTMQSFLCLGIVSILWVVFGYSLSFGPDVGNLIGNLDWAFLRNVSWEAGTGRTIPDMLFCAFQLMFAIITPALITGAFAERMKFPAYLIFTGLWVTFVYFPICHWVWGGGWLADMGALDFAGGTVIHINSGAAALVCAIVIGKRKGWGKEAMHPHNLPMTVLGAGVLWFGWFGFNAGSALAAGPIAALALMTTQVATGAGALTWVLAEWKIQGKPTTLGAASGAVAGLVAITPGCGFVTPLWAIVIGGVAGVICYLGVIMKGKLGYDDALDVVAVHGLGGLWGALATGIFASVGAQGLLYGNPKQLMVQAIGAGAAIAYSVVVTFIILKVIDVTVGLRVDSDKEQLGLDVAEHSEVGYSI
jgi:ammonium transporter, Amt family